METIEFTFPTNGMNSTLDAQVLPLTSGAYLENLTFNQGGNGFLRYGTRVLSLIQNTDIEIISLTTIGATATAVTSSPHGLNGLSRVNITGAYPLEYNVTNKRITYIDKVTFSYTVGETLASATGAPSLRVATTGSHQDLPDGHEIVKYFTFNDQPLVAVKVPQTYVLPDVTNNGDSLTIQNYIGSLLPYIGTDNQITLNYTLGGVPYTITTGVTEDEVQGTTLTLTLSDAINQAAIVTSLTYYVVRIYNFAESTGAYAVVSGDHNFFAFSPFRSTYFQKKLVIVNGVDPVHTWDGTTFAELKFIETLANNSVRNYQVLSQNSFQADLVAEGDPYRTSDIVVGWQYRGMPIASSVVNGNTVTLTTPIKHALQVSDEILLYETGLAEYDNKRFIISNVTEITFDIEVIGDADQIPAGQGQFNLLPIESPSTMTAQTDRVIVILADDLFPETNNAFTADKIKILYTKTSDSLPTFRFITVAHDRLWALGPGIDRPSGTLSTTDDMVIYYTNGENSLTAWTDPNTKSIPFINLQDKQNSQDSVIAIEQLAGGMVFIGREKTQIWQGTDPTLKTGDLSFVWHKTIPVGALHGNLVQSFGNDVLFMSKYGLLSLSSLSLINDFAASDVFSRAINKTLQMEIESFLQEEKAYLKARSFVYPKGRFFGFRINNAVFIYQNASYNKGWILFTGDFKTASDIVSDHLNNRLILAQKNLLYIYGDHVPYSFGDKDGTKAIYFRWMTPLLHFKHLWGNQRIELEANATALVDVSLGLMRNQNFLDAPQIIFTLSPDKAYFDVSPWNRSYWSQEVPQESVKKVKFVTEFLGAVISGYALSEVQLELKKLIFYGKRGQ